LSAQEWGNCSEWKCRLKSSDKLSRFAAWYSDHIYIQNYFDPYPEALLENKEQESRFDIAGDLKVLLALRPLIEGNIVSIVRHPIQNTCPNCMREKFPSVSGGISRVKREMTTWAKDYADRIKASVLLFHHERFGGYIIEFTGPEELIPHGKIGAFGGKTPAWLKQKIKAELDTSKKYQEIILSKDEILKTGFVKEQLSSALLDITLQQICSDGLKLNAKY